MILSASRRTDIPACYADWFFNRLGEGFVLVRNPMNFHRVSRVRLTPETVDGFVFWTKNPLPMLDRLGELEGYPYMFQCTLTAYGRDLEPGLPPQEDRLAALERLSAKIGPDRVVWRYDPILISDAYPLERHLEVFERLALRLGGVTRKVTFSFLDEAYRGVRYHRQALALRGFPEKDRIQTAAALGAIARGVGLAPEACAEKLDLAPYGVGRACCVDGRLFEKLRGAPLGLAKDKGQRPECQCAASLDIGQYNTCRNGCKYCYANYNPHALAGNWAAHNPASPLLTGEVEERDVVYSREGST